MAIKQEQHPMRKKYTFFDDPGHAWLEVPMADLERLAIDGAISGFSFIHGRMAYLEEDQDAGTFMDAAKANGWIVQFNEVHQDPTPIRDYAHYQAAPDYKAQLDKVYGRNQPEPTQGVRQL
jgi:hypothetical protein